MRTLAVRGIREFTHTRTAWSGGNGAGARVIRCACC
jgi:hypothetical protein